jgi:TolB-like protein
MAKVLISYNHKSKDNITALAGDINAIGHTVWYDRELSGGQLWWDKILEKVREYDVFVFVLDQRALESAACKSEYEYAAALGKPILPVLIGEGVSIDLLPPALSQIQFVSYRKDDHDAVARLAKAFNNLPPFHALPDPLPIPPPAPISRLGRLNEQAQATGSLSREEQSLLFLELKSGLDDPENAPDYRRILQVFRQRSDLLASIAKEIDALPRNPKPPISMLRDSHDPAPHTEAPWKKKNIRWFVVAGVLLAVLAGLLFFLPGLHPSRAGNKTIAVLPFTNLSGNAEQEYFSDGITGDILTQLCKVADLNVISRTTMMQYKGTKKTLREIGGELHAGVVLEGSVQRMGNRIRISGQLIDAVDDRQLWAETYDRELNDIFAIQSEIAQQIAYALQAKLTSAEKLRLEKPVTSNTEAYGLLLQGRYLFARQGEANVAKAFDLFQRALAIDPNDARVWASAAFAYIAQADRGYINITEGYARAREAAEKAIALDDKFADAHSAMGWIKRIYDWDWTGAEAEYRKAVSLEPGNVGAIGDMAWLPVTLGRVDEGIGLIRKSIALDPASDGGYSTLGVFLMRANRLDEAVTAFRQALALNAQRPNTHTRFGLVYLLQGKAGTAIPEIQKESDAFWRLYGLAMAYHGAGRKAEAAAALREFIETYENDSAFQIAELFAYRGDVDRAFEWLERAYVQRDAGLPSIKNDPFLKNIERDSRYPAFLRRMRLPG